MDIWCEMNIFAKNLIVMVEDNQMAPATEIGELASVIAEESSVGTVAGAADLTLHGKEAEESVDDGSDAEYEKVSADDEIETADEASNEKEAADDMDELDDLELSFESNDKDGSRIVRIGNFLVMKDLDKEHPFITVTTVARTWYVGYAPGQLAYIFLEDTLFGDVSPEDDDIRASMMFLVGLMAGVTTFNAKFTDGVVRLINEIG